MDNCRPIIACLLLLLSFVNQAMGAVALRSASCYPDSSCTDNRPYVPGSIVNDFGTSWGIVGMSVVLPERTKLVSITGVGGYRGAGSPSTSEPFINIYSTEEAFRLSNLAGDIYSGHMDLTYFEEFSQEADAGAEDYYLVLSPQESLILEQGSYVVAVGLELLGDVWDWAYSTNDLGNDLFVDNIDDTLFMLDDFSDTGTVAVDIFATPIPDGDYDFDGDVDGQDYLKWQSTFGSTIELDADGNGDGVVNAADYTIWRDNYDTPSQLATSVPEPSGLVLFLLSLLPTRFCINRYAAVRS